MSLSSQKTHPNKTICLVSGSHVSSNPRLVKEADALHAAGYRVHVIAGRNFAPADPLDALILARAQWTWSIVDYCSGTPARLQRLIRRLARLILARFPRAPLWLAARAHHSAAAQLSSAAARFHADLYIGHTLVGLVAAAHAARKNRARLGFDAEDFHSLETDAASLLPEEIHSIHALESAFLPRCVYLTAAAPLIAEAYATTYGVRTLVTVENVFPLAEAAANPGAQTYPAKPVRFYWFSQTIGPGRGLEQFLGILGRMKTPAILTLRGTLVNSAYAENLTVTARAEGFTGSIQFLPPAPATEMARLAARHDIGLALEPHTPLNRDLCLTNKLYTYLLAGLPIVCTPTRAQIKFAENLGDAAVITDMENPAEAAERLDTFLRDPHRCAASRQTSWNLGQSRYNWEREQPRLLDAVSQALRTALPAHRSVRKELARKTLRWFCRLVLSARSRRMVLSSTGPTLVLAPHMDDEALGCGGFMAGRIASGAELHVAYFTDGAAGLGPDSPVPPGELARIRQTEARTAMATLGLAENCLHFLNAPDGRLKHFTESERLHWRSALMKLLSDLRPAEILLPGRADGSSEHEALFALLASAVKESGLSVRVLEFPVWSWWNPRFLWSFAWKSERVWRVPVAPYASTKAKLLRSYPSQTTIQPHRGEAALSPDFLASFHSPDEFFFESRLPS
jgi:LmbE family N-acetylglucosaminyl deacetylase